MRKIAEAVLGLGLLAAMCGLVRSAPQQQPPFERIPNYGANEPLRQNAFPRWLSYTRINPAMRPSNANDGPNPNPTMLDDPGFGQELISSLAVDSRGVVHAVGLNANLDVEYFSTRFDTRRSNGFSTPTIIFTSTPAAALGAPPDIWVDAQDRVFVVWGVTTVQGAQPVTDLVYQSLGNGGWTPPTQITAAQAATQQAYGSPQIVVDSTGVGQVICSLYDNTFGPGGSTRVYLVTTTGLVSQVTGDFTGAARVAIQSNNMLHVVWAQGPGATTLNYVAGGVGGWGAPVQLSGNAQDSNPDIAVDSLGVPHAVWCRQNPPTFTIFHWVNGLLSTVNGNNAAAGSPRILMDSRDQTHVVYPGSYNNNPGAGGQTTTGLCYAARVNNPNPGSTLWRRQEPMAAMVNDVARGIPMPPNLQFTANPFELSLSRNDVIHVLDENGIYTRTLDPGIGVRDGSSMVGALPGGAVNVVSGNLNIGLPLFSTSGAGLAQSVGLTYNAMDFSGGSIGGGWKLNYEIYLVDHYFALNNPNGFFTDQPYETITLFLGNGRPVHFQYRTLQGEGNPDGSFLVAEDEFGFVGKLERTTPNVLPCEYRLTFKSGDIWIFNTEGKLREIQDAAGNFIMLTYGAGVLTEITDLLPGNGRTTAITYETGVAVRYSPRIQTITDPDDKVYTLTYASPMPGDTSLLASVEFTSGPFQPTWNFDYYRANQFGNWQRVDLLSALTTPRGNDWTCRYLPDNRVYSIQDPLAPVLAQGVPDGAGPGNLSPTMFVSYNEGLVLTQPRESTVLNRNGNSFRYVHQSRMGVVREIFDPYAGGNGLVSTLRTLNQYGRVTDVRDRWGFTTTYNFLPPNALTPHVFDNLDSIVRPTGDGLGTEVVSSQTYLINPARTRVLTSTIFVTPTDETSAVQRVTSFTYNPVGQLTRIDFPTVTRPDGASQTAFSTFEYNGPRASLSRSVNEEGNAVTYQAFDAITGLPTSVLRDGGTQAELFGYDTMGNPTSHTMPQGGPNNAVPQAMITVYDGMYRVFTTSDAAGHTTTYSHDLDSHQVGVQPPAGSASTTAYDERGYASGGTSADGSWSQLVDANGNVQRSVDLRGFATNFDFDALDRMIETRSPGASTGGGGGGPATHTTQYAHDIANGTLRNSTVTRVGAPMNRTTTTEHDARGRARAVVEADTLTRMEMIFDEQDQVVASQKLYNGAIQSCSVSFRDERQRVHQARSQDATYVPGGMPANFSDTFTLFNRAGSAVRTTDANFTGNWAMPDHATTYSLDARERVSEVRNGQNYLVSRSVYGDDDLVIETFVPDPATKGTGMVSSMKYEYTARKELRHSENRDCFGTTTAYNALSGQVDTVTDALGRVTKSTYDGSTQRIDEVITAYGLPGESRVKSTWTNALMTKATVFNPAGGSYNSEYARVYDQAGRLERYACPTIIGGGQALSAETTTFNDFGEVGVTTIGSKSVTNGYNALGQNVSRQWAGPYSTLIMLGYDGSGNNNSFDDDSFRRQMSYTPWKNTPFVETFSIKPPMGAWTQFSTQTHTYDASNSCTNLTDPAVVPHEWVLDADNRVSVIRYNNVDICGMTYTPGGLLDTTTLRNAAGTIIARTIHYYDGLGRHVRAHTVNANGTTLTDFKWQYDRVNRVIRTSLSHLGVEFVYGYDDRDNLSSEVTPGSVVPPFDNTIADLAVMNESDDPSNEALSPPGTALNVAPRTAGWVYDKAGNRTSQTIDGITTTYEHNEASQLVAEEKATSLETTHVDHFYDEWGNEIERITEVTPTVGPVTTTDELYGYNYLNVMSLYIRSVQVDQDPPTEVANWQYDFWPTGDRFQKVNTQTTVKELYSPRFGDVVTDYAQTGAGPITITNAYSQGTGIDTKNTRIPYSGGNPVVDARIHFIGDMVGTVSVTLTDAGAANETSVKDAWGNQLSGDTSSERYGYSQRELDTESSLVFMRHRMYDPARGRFTQTDPIRGNRPHEHYLYARNNPISGRDPMGLEVQIPESEKSVMITFFGAENVDFTDAGGGFFKVGLKDGAKSHIEKYVKETSGSAGFAAFLQNAIAATTFTWKGLTAVSSSWQAFVKAQEPSELTPVRRGYEIILVPDPKKFHEEQLATLGGLVNPNTGAMAFEMFMKDLLVQEATGAAGAGTSVAANALRRWAISRIAPGIQKLLTGLKAGPSPGVKVVGSEAELNSLFSQLSAGGKPITGTTRQGPFVELPDGTKVGLRPFSSPESGGGPTIDIFPPSGPTQKVHIQP